MINISKAIYYLLANSSVTGYTGTRIYPIVMPENTPFPMVVYERRTNPEYSKDDAVLKLTTGIITVISDDYTESINIANAVNSALENYNGVVSGIDVKDIMLDSVDEIFANGAYMQKLVYNILSV